MHISIKILVLALAAIFLGGFGLFIYWFNVIYIPIPIPIKTNLEVGSRIEFERVGKHPDQYDVISKIVDGDVTCYVVNQPSGVALSCLQKQP